MAKLFFIQSVMEGGKSALLLMEAHSFDRREITILCMKPAIDTRDGEDVIKSRIGISRDCLTIMPHHNLYTIIDEIVEATKKDNLPPLQWILIDEAQFLTEEHVNQLRCIVDDFDINVRCYGLRTDFQTHFFEGSKRLMEIADTIEEMKIPCKCGNKAIFNVRFNENGEMVTDGEQILIGGEDIYKPMCSKCYREMLKQKK